MKNFKLLVLGLLISTASAFATNPVIDENPEPVTVKQELVNQVDKYLGKHELDIDKTTTARLTFMVTPDSEILVVKVNTNDEGVESYIKSKLNYKEVKDVKEAQNKIYTMKVRIEPSEK